MSETRTTDPFDSYMAARLGKPVAQVTAALNADDDDESCPRCGTVNWGRTPDGALECVTCGYTEPEPEFAEADGHEIAAQIGMGNILAISGGRINVRRTGITLPCGCGYSVTIDLAGNDTYTVRRVLTRAGKAWVKGEMTGVYCDQVGEVAYRAGMFRDEWVAGSAS